MLQKDSHNSSSKFTYQRLAISHFTISSPDCILHTAITHSNHMVISVCNVQSGLEIMKQLQLFDHSMVDCQNACRFCNCMYVSTNGLAKKE